MEEGKKTNTLTIVSLVLLVIPIINFLSFNIQSSDSLWFMILILSPFLLLAGLITGIISLFSKKTSLKWKIIMGIAIVSAIIIGAIGFAILGSLSI